ncbi:MAG: protein translocase subunit SecD [Lachnospiraceae bacterium]|nr:protein translocase subunit SecD [Lachnospiraceae bacterium]
MKKVTAVITLIVLVALLAVFGITCTTGFTGEGGAAKDIPLGLDLEGGVSITYKVVGDGNPSKEDMSDTIYKLQQRVSGYSTESVVYQEGSDRINIEIPGVTDANEILEELGKPGQLYFIRETAEDGSKNYQMVSLGEGFGYTYMLSKDIEDLISTGDVVLNGTDVKTAQAGSIQDQMTKNNEFVVSLSMTEEGTKKFADATTKAFAAGESIAIYYDGQIVSAPRVNAAITDGQAQITGSFTYEEAEHLASTIRIGGLKLELEELHSKIVGAQLGTDAISTSLKAGLIGFILIVVFMIVVYRVAGFAASLALALYAELIIILLDAFEITLTLPGIAGIILSIGMAVDANVIIFARVREELAKGKTVDSSVDIGFKKARSAILDGNITTLIAAAVLGVLGTGSIKGFAATLALGIILSMFTAMVITRLIMKAFLAIGLKSEKLYGVAKERKPIGFLGKKNLFFIISGAAILAGFIFMAINAGRGVRALNYSLDFVGGTSTEITFNEDLSLADIDSKVVPLIEKVTGDGNVQSQKIEGTNNVIFKTRSLSPDERTKLADDLVENFGVDADNITSETISSTISSEMKLDAVIAVVVASLLMLAYIWIRFKDVRFGCSSVLALIHDVLVVLAFYAIARVSVGSTFIACMLTIVGYSINATIVIFDRIRENAQYISRKDSYEEMVNNSITQTLSRSVFTSLTTFIMVAALYVLGVTSIKEFALPLMVGILCGTYSSICLASAIYMVLRKVWKIKKES